MSSNKHFFTDRNHLVHSSLSSIPLLNPAVALDVENKVIYQKSPAPNTISLVSGGGAGHEPSFAAFVGDGILTAAVSGSIFASPSPSQVFNAVVNRVDNSKGVLLVIMNYTGDVLNFGLGCEKAAAREVNTRMVVVGDDVGVGREKGGKVGRRGIAGTVLVHKIVGALAATGADLDTCAQVAELVADNLVSVGCSLEHVGIPGREVAADGGLGSDELELGMGIHNEQGSARMKIPNASELIETMLKQLLDENDTDRSYLGHINEHDEWVLLVNNLGGLSPLELGGIVKVAMDGLVSKYKITPKRVYAGPFMTSLNGPGFSITLLRLRDTGLPSGQQMLDLLDAPHQTLGWTGTIPTQIWKQPPAKSESTSGQSEEKIASSNMQLDIQRFKEVVQKACNALVEKEAEISHYDEQVGDGDCGGALAKGAKAAIAVLEDSQLTDDAVVVVSKIANAIEKHMDGTSGALYSIFFNALAKALRNIGNEEKTRVSSDQWANATHRALESLRRYTPARPGDRTLIDALEPFVDTLLRTQDVRQAAQKAFEGAERTKGMKAKLGRSVYIGDVGQVPDPGAIGVAVFVTALADALVGKE